MDLLITGGRLIDPANSRDGIFDVWVKNGKIAAVGKSLRSPQGAEIISAEGKWVMPGLVDVHVHLREPGGEKSETIETGTRSAAAGGVTTVFAMANTKPPIDTPKKVRWVLKRTKETAVVRVCPVGAVTKGLEGRELTDIPGLVRAGCAAISDDGREIMDSGLFRKALIQAKAAGVPLIDHCEDENLSKDDIPLESEAIMVARAIYLARLTGARIHLAHMSTQDSVDLVRRAKKRKIAVTAETCPHYICLTKDAIQRHGTYAKMKPPLRSRKDVEALQEGLADGTIDTISTDHAPHDRASKRRKFPNAPFGIIGLETSFSIVYEELIKKKILSPMEAVRKMTQNPAENFGLDCGTLSRGALADIAIFDPSLEWTANRFDSKSVNSPFIGRKFRGKMVCTVVGGRIIKR